MRLLEEKLTYLTMVSSSSPTSCHADLGGGALSCREQVDFSKLAPIHLLMRGGDGEQTGTTFVSCLNSAAGISLSSVPTRAGI